MQRSASGDRTLGRASFKMRARVGRRWCSAGHPDQGPGEAWAQFRQCMHSHAPLCARCSAAEWARSAARPCCGARVAGCVSCCTCGARKTWRNGP